MAPLVLLPNRYRVRISFRTKGTHKTISGNYLIQLIFSNNLLHGAHWTVLTSWIIVINSYFSNPCEIYQNTICFHTLDIGNMFNIQQQ